MEHEEKAALAGSAMPQPDEGRRGRQRRRGHAWMLVLRENLLPLAVAFGTTLVFLRLDQAREALFGTIGVAPRTDAPAAPPADHIGSQFLALVVSIALLAAAVWYASRLLLTIDAATRTKLARMAVRRRVTGLVEEFPRWMGAGTAALLVTALIDAQAGSANGRRFGILVGAVATLVPIVAMVFVARRHSAHKLPGTARMLAFAAGWGLLTLAAVGLSRPEHGDIPIVIALSLLCLMPALLYAAAAWRRPLLRRLGLRAPPADAGLDFIWAHGVMRLCAMGMLGIVILLLLATGRPAAARSLGSAAIVLLAMAAILCILCAVTLVLRRLSNRAPGLVTGALALSVAAYLVLHAAFGWSPFREPLGNEVLPAQSLPQGRRVEAPVAPNIVVNAYGGGLRSALFSAQILAELDDRSCGEFGRRIERLSGVSGGSLGIAVYLLLREEVVAAGGWPACAPGVRPAPWLAPLVEQALLQDHLSAALARLFTTDLVPSLRPERGQALLESWNGTLIEAQKSAARGKGPEGATPPGLALPLHLLNGGLAPAPVVYFNTTQAQDGRRRWFSNRHVASPGPGVTRLAPAFQVGQAVLHSARFPFISPAGAYPADSDRLPLVDGGYADNSGAGTLEAMEPARTPGIWLDIDGNRDESIYRAPGHAACRELDEETGGIYSAVDALLGVRRSQADLAVSRYARYTRRTHVHLAPDMVAAFAPNITDENERCARIRELRGAPLGWYLTPVTAGNQARARAGAVDKACRMLEPLCKG